MVEPSRYHTDDGQVSMEDLDTLRYTVMDVYQQLSSCHQVGVVRNLVEVELIPYVFGPLIVDGDYGEQDRYLLNQFHPESLFQESKHQYLVHERVTHPDDTRSRRRLRHDEEQPPTTARSWLAKFTFESNGYTNRETVFDDVLSRYLQEVDDAKEPEMEESNRRSVDYTHDRSLQQEQEQSRETCTCDIPSSTAFTIAMNEELQLLSDYKYIDMEAEITSSTEMFPSASDCHMETPSTYDGILVDLKLMGCASDLVQSPHEIDSLELLTRVSYNEANLLHDEQCDPHVRRITQVSATSMTLFGIRRRHRRRLMVVPASVDDAVEEVVTLSMEDIRGHVQNENKNDNDLNFPASSIAIQV